MVEWNGTEVYYVANPAAVAWTELTGTLTATSTRTVLQSGAENQPNYFGLDDVSVTPVPTAAVAGVTRQGTALSLSYYTVPGVSYQLQYCTNLSQAIWIGLATHTTAGFTTTVTDDSGINAVRFYRLCNQRQDSHRGAAPNRGRAPGI